MKLLDLFCGAGGAGMGYHRAGFDVAGVDINPQPRYPFEFHQADALEYLAEHGHEFDVIHASPPCQAYVDYNVSKESKHPKLIEPTRGLLIESGKPYVIENVYHAGLNAALMLCGTMFNLRVIRHRYFESNIPFPLTTPCNHIGTVADGYYAAVYARGGHGHRMGRGKREPKAAPAQISKSDAMGINWMKEKELHEAIPPAYTEWIGRQIWNKLNNP